MSKKSVLTFRIQDQFCAIDIAHVIEVAAMVELTSIQTSQAEILGFVNRHGKSLTLLDMRLVMGKFATPIDIATFFIVVKANGQEIGLVVDEVIQVDYVEDVNPVPTDARYVKGVFSRGKHLAQLIAVELLINTFLRQETEG